MVNLPKLQFMTTSPTNSPVKGDPGLKCFKDFEVSNLKLRYRNEIEVEDNEPQSDLRSELVVKHTIKNTKGKIEKVTTFQIGGKIYSLKDVFEYEEFTAANTNLTKTQQFSRPSNPESVILTKQSRQEKIWFQVKRRIHRLFFEWLRTNQNPKFKELFKTHRKILERMILCNFLSQQLFYQAEEYIELREPIRTFLNNDKQLWMKKLSVTSTRRRLKVAVEQLIKKYQIGDPQPEKINS